MGIALISGASHTDAKPGDGAARRRKDMPSVSTI